MSCGNLVAPIAALLWATLSSTPFYGLFVGCSCRKQGRICKESGKKDKTIRTRQHKDLSY